MVIDVARTKGITDKKLLVHHFGNCQNHIRNGWCNEVAIGFGKRAVDSLADSLICFAPHLRISGELDNMHRLVACLSVVLHITKQLFNSFNIL